MRWKKTSKHTCSMLTAHISHIQVYLYEMNGKCSDFSVDVDNFKERKMLMMSMELKLRNEISSMYIRIFIHWMHNLYETTNINFCWRGFVHIFFLLNFCVLFSSFSCFSSKSSFENCTFVFQCIFIGFRFLFDVHFLYGRSFCLLRCRFHSFHFYYFKY